MIDLENEVYTMVATALRNQFPGIDVASDYVDAPAGLPHVSIYMADNYTPMTEQTNSTKEDYVVMMFQVDVYSNKVDGKKTEAKKIANYVSDLLHAHNFIRTSQSPMPNLRDAGIYRITARYRVGSDGDNYYRR